LPILIHILLYCYSDIKYLSTFNLLIVNTFRKFDKSCKRVMQIIRLITFSFSLSTVYSPLALPSRRCSSAIRTVWANIVSAIARQDQPDQKLERLMARPEALIATSMRPASSKPRNISPTASMDFK